MTRRILHAAAIAALATAAWCAQTAVAARQAPAKSAPQKKQAAPASKAGTTGRTAGSRTGRKTAVQRTTWRNRQMAPSPERYKEIQEALVAKGYLKPEDASGAWGEASTDALKRFQADQNLDSSGKINALSLIALGLGPKHDAGPAAKPAAQ